MCMLSAFDPHDSKEQAMMQDTRPAPAIDERFAISILEAAKVLGISRSYAYQMAATGELPTLRLGRRILVPVAALRELVGLDH